MTFARAPGRPSRECEQDLDRHSLPLDAVASGWKLFKLQGGQFQLRGGEGRRHEWAGPGNVRNAGKGDHVCWGQRSTRNSGRCLWAENDGWAGGGDETFACSMRNWEDRNVSAILSESGSYQERCRQKGKGGRRVAKFYVHQHRRFRLLVGQLQSSMQSPIWKMMKAGQRRWVPMTA